MRRKEALEAILHALGEEDAAVFSTGMISREAFGLKDRPGNFYMLGSMGHASSIAMGIALAHPSLRAVAVEGDGSLLMNLGSLAMAVGFKVKNFYHLVLDNQSYSSTGGQPTLSTMVPLDEVARACGYASAERASDLLSLREALKSFFLRPGPAFLLVRIHDEHDDEPPRVSISPEEMRKRFMDYLKGGKPLSLEKERGFPPFKPPFQKET